MNRFLFCCYMLFPIIAFSQSTKPNILFCIADDWGWPHAGVYGDQVVKTPAFDQLAANGILFEEAFVSSPSCTPSRGAVLSGQHFFRLGQGANLWSTLNKSIPVYPLLLEEAGYFVGSWRKAWGPGDLRAGGYGDVNPAGKVFKGGLEAFLQQKPDDQPFCFWLGSPDPHRPYDKGIGKRSGIHPDRIKVPAFYPDVDEIKNDLADYYFEVQRFDSDIAKAIEVLRQHQLLENTIIVVTGDHGMPFPRCKGNLYDMGARVPLVISWPAQIKKNRVFDGVVSLTDLAPTFLEAAGVAIPETVTGHSLLGLCKNENMETAAKQRQQVIFGRERHTPAQERPSLNGYPSRALRTQEYLLIKNYKPERWPAGAPTNSTHPIGSFADCDDGPTKSYLIAHQANKEIAPFFNLSFAKRPAVELYQIKTDPYQIHNLADDPKFADVKQRLLKELESELEKAKDPRVLTPDPPFDHYPYLSQYQLKN
ncbi:sulfatase [Niabella insulamsoli]|uniref:sulfatase family protein n=1 Tax=Niabella insulamsoli TaxID=3144874 RepID=UPI0031FBDAC8